MLDKVLIVASSDASQEPAFRVVTELRGSGYGSDICRGLVHDSNIKPDRMLTPDSEIHGYKGVVFLDDGGELKSCVSLAVRADKAGMMVAGYAKGCLILLKAKLLKGKYLCMGLPEEAYKGAKLVKSKAVRSDNIVTCSGNCTTAFVVLLLDCLGGDVKKVVKSWVEKDMVNSDEMMNLLSDRTKVAELVGPICGPIVEAPVSTHSFLMTRTAGGWVSKTICSVVSQPPSLEGARLAEKACIAIQSGLQDPSGANVLSVGVGTNNGAPQLSHVLSPSQGEVVENNHQDSAEDHKLVVEREMGNEGMYVQPDGKLAIRDHAGLKAVPVNAAVQTLRSEVYAALREQLDVKGLDAEANAQAAKVAARAKHRLMLIEEFLNIKKTDRDFSTMKVAGIYDSGVQGPFSNLDVPMSERVYEWHEDDDELQDRDRAIQELPRYNPETDDGEGFYFGKTEIPGHNESPMDAFNDDPSREPTSWQQVLDGDTPYKMRKTRP